MKFYVLAKPETDSLLDLAGGIDVTQSKYTQTGDFPTCPKCNFPMAMREWLPPHQIELELWGKAYGDLAIVNDGLIVSERAKNMFIDKQLNGLIDFKPVEVVKILFRRGKVKDSPPRYFKASVKPSLTVIDQNKSGYVWKHPEKVCPVCVLGGGGELKRFNRIVIDITTWVGDDIFYPIGGTRLLVSERFRVECEHHNIRSVHFIPAELASNNYCPWED
ncbi:MAG: hypothetical protein ACRCZF_00755 [Gemmataceae bacterium]